MKDVQGLLSSCALPGAGASAIAFDLGPIEVGKARRTGEIASLSAKPLQLGNNFVMQALLFLLPDLVRACLGGKIRAYYLSTFILT